MTSLFSTPRLDSSRSESPTFSLEDILRSGDYVTLKSVITKNINVSENIIIDCAKGIEKARYHKMEIYGSILFNRFKCWRIVLENINREISENELESIIFVVNSMYKDINWNHAFWKQISCNPNLNQYAKNWIKSRTQ